MADFLPLETQKPMPAQLVIARMRNGLLWVVEFLGDDDELPFAWNGFRLGGFVAWAPIANGAAVREAITAAA